MELSDVLNEEESKAPEAPKALEKEQVAEETKTEAPAENLEYTNRRKDLQRKEWAAQGRDPETGQFLPKGKEEEVKAEPKVEAKVEPEVKAEPKKEEFTEKERAFLRGLEEERRKRQELERQLAALQQPKTETEKKTFWDDPEGHLKQFEQGITQRISQKEQEVRLATAEAIARTKYKDFDEKIQVFAEVLKSSPGLSAQWLADPDPAEFAYRTGERTKLLREAGSIDELRAKIEKETRAKLEAEYKAKQDELEKLRSGLTPSLSDVRGASKQQQPVYTGPTPLEDILSGK